MRGHSPPLVEPPFPSSRIYQRPPWRPARVRLPPMGADAGRGLEVTESPLVVTRPQILAFRRRAGALDQRLPPGRRSLRQAAWAGLQDSMPRAALLSIHARVEGAGPSSWEDPSFVQLWGPRYQVYVVAERDLPAFSLGRLPDDANGRGRAEETAARLHAHLGGRRMGYGEAGHGLGINANSLRYGATTGTVLIRWEGARQPTVWTVPPPDVEPQAARLELARRYLHVFGPSTPGAFAVWAGISRRAAVTAFEALQPSLTDRPHADRRCVDPRLRRADAARGPGAGSAGAAAAER